MSLLRAGLVVAAALAVGAGPTGRAAEPSKPRPEAQKPKPARPASRPYCSGEYADDLAALTPAARESELQQRRYTYCVRTLATYECPYYAADGTLKRDRKRVVAHGTGFGIRVEGGDTLVVTNEHVADWPAVTSAEHRVEGVPAGCRRVSDGLRIVQNESDEYERDDVVLSRVVADPQLDIAVLRAKQVLPVLPWKIGRSAALRERNAVEVRGFPLGVLRTNSVGKVTSAYQHDDQGEWDHDDFVMDALLSEGNSGSPVLAVSCRTGELELVGVYHAGYDHGSALNVVVGIDQAREMLDTLRRAPRVHPDQASTLATESRRRLGLDLLMADAFFPFGPTTAAATARPDGTLLFEVMARDFPVLAEPVLVLEDLPPSDDAGFGQAGRVWVGKGFGLRPLERSDLDADAQAQLAHALDALRRDALLATELRDAGRAGAVTRERFEALARLERSVRKLTATRQEVGQGVLELSERLGHEELQPTLSMREILSDLEAPRAAPGGVASGAPPGATPPIDGK